MDTIERNTRHYGHESAKEKKASMIVPPVINRAAATAGGVLNKSLFLKRVDLAAATVANNSQILSWRKALQQERSLLQVDRLSSVAPHPDKVLAGQGKKCLLLEPRIRADVPDTWGPVLREGVRKKELCIMPYELRLDYSFWSYHDIMTAILPEEFHGDIPCGFNTAGHVAHLNLRDQFKPYKKLVAEVLLDKNPIIRTVINKVDMVGSGSEFRTFQYEVLAGDDNLQVQVSEGGCVFEFDYSKVYWNSKLEAEHRRIITMLKPGEVLCDVMAGIGPFAVPAGKRGVFVWANDMNPESYASLQHAIGKNKVSPFVRPFNQDGRLFIPFAADSVLEAHRNAYHAIIPPKRPTRSRPLEAAPAPTRIPLPPTIAHFVMNLPASALTFLRHYRGLYAGQEALFTSGNNNSNNNKLPMVHVHCFGPKADGEAPLLDVRDRVNAELAGPGAAAPLRLGERPEEEDGTVRVRDVRDVAPTKSMFCASFRLPAEVAFAPRERRRPGCSDDGKPAVVVGDRSVFLPFTHHRLNNHGL
ncbi:hypothetical protein P8C59_003617 [Phyllachora maydis]|uniref:tRNA (guanine(37)-N1)-methyltransferase n=1 Tax=Phyllachora maydis TaxID=1825666 RepID=A0AAD9I2D2_9PEZI|nr:hypothetical protein P8C59_003617 [Phyllachora maydis]